MLLRRRALYEFDPSNMWKLILYFVLINLGYFALVVAIYAFGWEYDKANKLYPEVVQLSYDLSISGIYGQRWVRFLQGATAAGLVADVVIAFIWYLRRPEKSASLEI